MFPFSVEISFSQPVDEAYLVKLASSVLSQQKRIPLGKLGTLLHKAANDYTVPAFLKEKFGGLRSFLLVSSDARPYDA